MLQALDSLVRSQSRRLARDRAEAPWACVRQVHRSRRRSVRATTRFSPIAGPEGHRFPGLSCFGSYVASGFSRTYKEDVDEIEFRGVRCAPAARVSVVHRPPRNRSPASGMRASSSTSSRSRSASRSPATAPPIKGSFFNGDEKVTSTSGSARERHAHAQLRRIRHEGDRHASRTDARGRVQPRDARRAVSVHGQTVHAGRRSATRNIPAIAGLWNIQVGKSSKGEAAWQLIVRQSGAEVSAAILRVDGDTGALTGIVSRRQVRAESLLRRAAVAARADAGSRRDAGGRAEQETNR